VKRVKYISDEEVRKDASWSGPNPGAGTGGHGKDGLADLEKAKFGRGGQEGDDGTHVDAGEGCEQAD
jgi:hypothetical protein